MKIKQELKLNRKNTDHFKTSDMYQSERLKKMANEI